MYKVTFLDKVFDALHGFVVAQVAALANQLQVPAEWLIQFLNSHVQIATGRNPMVAKTANVLLQNALYAGYFPHMSFREVMDYMSGGKGPGTYEERMVNGLLDYTGSLNSYYDLYCALVLPEMIGKADEWASPDDTGRPLTKRGFKLYIRSTVPEENHRLIFGEVA